MYIKSIGKQNGIYDKSNKSSDSKCVSQISKILVKRRRGYNTFSYADTGSERNCVLFKININPYLYEDTGIISKNNLPQGASISEYCVM